MKYRNNISTNKFSNLHHRFTVIINYGRDKSPYDVVVTHKPITRSRCNMTITNRETNESISILVKLGYNYVESKLKSLYEEHLQDIKDIEENKQRRIKHVEALIARHDGINIEALV